MNTVVLKDKKQLLNHQAAILGLFKEAFGEELDSAVWEWAYINNPFGQPYVALAFDQGLVGHYAVIPYPLSDRSGRDYKSYLSMTTMIAQSHRKYGLFTTLAKATYEELLEDGADWVMGFPNEMSAPGFKKRLEWQLLEPDVVVSVGKSELMELFSGKNVERHSARECLFPDLDNRQLRDWRLSKPGAKYFWKGGVAFKEYGSQIDVIYYCSPEALKNLPDASTYNVLVPSSFIEDKSKVSFEYLFGGIGLSQKFSPDMVRRYMCLSDVF